jgi:hypothetical protein
VEWLQASLAQVPVRTFGEWDDLRPGFFEADLVAHGGGSTDGSFLLYTLCRSSGGGAPFFWDLHDRLFAGQNELDDQSLVRYAREPDLDAEAVAQELAEQTHVVRLEDQRQSGITSGVAGTPTVPFDGRRYDGSGSLPKMPAAIPRLHPEVRVAEAPAHGPRIPRIRWPRKDERWEREVTSRALSGG